MVDYRKIQDSLNADEKLRKEFLDDPVGTLKKHGVAVSPEKETTLKEFVREARAGQAKAAGATTSKSLSINGGIAISIRF